MKKPGPSSFEATYPAITRWVKEFGRIEIGQDDFMDNFVKAIDRGGMPWGGKSEYKSIDEALLDMEKGIKALLEDQSLDKRASPKRRLSKRSAQKAGKPPSRAGKEQHRSKEEQKIVNKVEKLDEITEGLRQGKDFPVTRLTLG
jgi:hypothetical protein